MIRQKTVYSAWHENEKMEGLLLTSMYLTIQLNKVMRGLSPRGQNNIRENSVLVAVLQEFRHVEELWD